LEEIRFLKLLKGKKKIPLNVKVIKGFIVPGMVDAYIHFFGVEEDNFFRWNLDMKSES